MFLRMNVGLIGFLNLFWLNRALEHLRNVDFSQTDSTDSNMELNSEIVVIFEVNFQSKQI